jgi:hypothetical protein
MVKFLSSFPRKRNPERFNGRLNSGSLLYNFCYSFDLHNKCNRLKFNSINMVFIVILSIIFLRLKTPYMYMEYLKDCGLRRNDERNMEPCACRFRLGASEWDASKKPRNLRQLEFSGSLNTFMVKHPYIRPCFVQSIHTCSTLVFWR